MTGAGLSWLVEALVASTLLIGLVLLVRVPVRRAFGAPVAYALWALPLLRLVLPPLPAGWRDEGAAPMVAPLATPFHHVGQQVTTLIVPAATAGDAAVPAILSPGFSLALLWALGAAAFLTWHILSYRRFRRRVLARASVIDRVGGVTIVASPAVPGPLAFGVVRRFVGFPHDVAARYDALERDLALAHELGHHARGDLLANWIALAVLALHWFNPLAWYAFRAFRADQEMANDARVLAQLGHGARHAYACTIVKAAHRPPMAAACHLHSINDLKGRLKMLATFRMSRTRVLSGLVTIVATGAAALALTASGSQAAERVRNGVKTAARAALPAASPAPAPTRHVHVVTERDGKRVVLDGAAAEAWVAAHPLPAIPAPPAPPVPDAPAASGAAPAVPLPPTPPAPPAATNLAAAVPDVRSVSCGGTADGPLVVHDTVDGRRRITVCTDRVERTSARASAAALRAADVQRSAMASARERMLAARRTLVDSRSMVAADRDHALAGLDAGLAGLDAAHEEH